VETELHGHKQTVAQRAIARDCVAIAQISLALEKRAFTRDKPMIYEDLSARSLGGTEVWWL
jgi:hypothetical protein